MRSLFTDVHSLWQKEKTIECHPLSHDLDCDVCVIGAGIAGLTTAYFLLKDGKSVVVIDRESRLGLHETGLSSGQLSNALDNSFSKVLQLHGSQATRLAAESHTEAIRQIEKIVHEENIECDFRRVGGYLFLGENQNQDILRQELHATQAAGLNGAELLSRAPTTLFDTGPCIYYPNQAQFHPLKYLNGLARAIIKNGGMIFTETWVTQIQAGQVNSVLTDEGFEIQAGSVVVATNVPFNDKLNVQTKLAPYRSYILCVQIPKNEMTDMLLWDTNEPFHFMQLIQNKNWKSDLLLVGGEDHRTGQDGNPENRYRNLKQWIQNKIRIEPEVVARWSGQVIQSTDYLGFIGRNPGNEEDIFIITGDSGQGLTNGTLGAMIIRDLILKRPNRWAELYNPSRVKVKALNNYLSENIRSALAYGDWLSSGEFDEINRIPLGEGAILREGAKKIAVYRDSYGHPHVFSAVCPHLGGVVRWNSLEKTWECPCHGSRFHCQGEVINGPAPQGLYRFEERIEDQSPEKAYGFTIQPSH